MRPKRGKVAAVICVARDVVNPDNRVMNLIFEAPVALAVLALSLMALWTMFSKL